MNTRKIMGYVTFTVLVTGVSYSIYKYLQSKEADEPITVEQAQAIAELHRIQRERVSATTVEENMLTPEEVEEIQDDARDTVNWNMGFAVSEYDFYDGLRYDIPLVEYMEEEDKQLRYDPNTIQARDQFIKMELAELRPAEREYQILKRLFDISFEPLNDGDTTLHCQLFDYRAGFFGSSKWNEDVSMADVIIHYARRANYDLGGSIASWLVYLLQHTNFHELSSDAELTAEAIQHNRHIAFDSRSATFGMFGLTQENMYDAKDMADENVDGEVTYEIEFQTFLKTQI